MWNDRHTVDGGERTDLLEFGEAATHAQIGLCDIDAAARDELLEAPAGKLRFAAGDGEAERLSHPPVAVAILRGDGFLEEKTAVSLQHATHADRGGGVVGVVA